jgi:hypothetical protein
MEMKAPRTTATLQEQTPTLLCDPNIYQPGKILRTEIVPSKLLKIKGRMGNLRISY